MCVSVHFVLMQLPASQSRNELQVVRRLPICSLRAEPHPVSQCALRQLVSSHGLVGVWRRMHTSSRQFTWFHISDNRISLARLNHIHCLQHYFNIFKTCRILPVGFTDHSLLLGSVFINKILPIRSHLKMSTGILIRF